MSGFLKTVWENSTSALSGRFFSPETIPKVDDIKIKSKFSAFLLPLHVYLPFIALLSLFFCPFRQGLKKVLKFSEIKVQLNSRLKRAFFSRQKLSPKSTI